MKSEEAIERIEILINYLSSRLQYSKKEAEICQALKMGAGALLKNNEAKKPISIKPYIYDAETTCKCGFCPSCGRWVDEISHDTYCPSCAQKLDWTGDENGRRRENSKKAND